MGTRRLMTARALGCGVGLSPFLLRFRDIIATICVLLPLAVSFAAPLVAGAFLSRFPAQPPIIHCLLATLTCVISLLNAIEYDLK